MTTRPSLRDVAVAAGVSTSTASRALSGSLLVSAATRERIQEIADTLGYSPNFAARSLRTSESRLVGLIVPNLQNPTFTQIAAGVQGRLRSAGYEVVMSTSESEETNETTALHTLYAHQVDGVILLGSQFFEPSPPPRPDFPMVYLTREPADGTATRILTGDEQASRDAVAYLAALGHRRIALVTGKAPALVAGFTAGLAAAGLAPDEDLVVIGEYGAATGAEGINTLLALPSPPTAVILAAQPIWQGALSRIVERDVRVPEDLSIICREETSELGWWRPRMTTIDIDTDRICALAVDSLLAQMQGQPDLGVGRVVVPSTLHVRDSCAPFAGSSD